MLFDRGIVAPGVDAGYVDNDSAFGGKTFPGKIRQYNPGTQPFLKVNRNGERFANESCPYNDIVYAAAHQPGRVYAQICDANILEDAKRFHTIGCSAQTRNGGEKYFQGKVDEAVAAGTLFVCDTIEELAEKLGIPADTFVETIERYNSFVDAQKDDDFGKPLFGEKIDEAPFVATPRSPSLHHTMGGVKIDTNTHVISTEGNVIDGLYAAGEVTGGLHAGNRLGGNAMTDFLVFGRIAGENAAKAE